MKWKSLVSVVCSVLLLVLTYIPFVFVLANSMKTGQQYIENPFSILWTFHASNYVQAWVGTRRYLLNTIIVAAASIAIAIPIAAAGAYAFAQTHFRGKQIVFYAYLGLIMIPQTLTLIPLFVEVKSLNLFGTWWALILPYAAGAQPLLVYLFRVFFEGISSELYESARLDGCGETGVLFRIVAPLSVPILMTGAILMSVNIWGDYLWPTIVLTNYKSFTISAGIQTYLSSFGLSAGGIGPAFAGYILSMLPIIILVVASMRYFVNGIASGATKG